MARSIPIVVLTGAGASVPLELPAMAGIISEDFYERLDPSIQPLFAIAENWSVLQPGGVVDFELLYTCAEVLSNMKRDDPVSLPFVRHRSRGGFIFSANRGNNIVFDLDKEKEHAKQLLEALRNEIHNKVGTLDPNDAAELYLPLFQFLFEMQRDHGEIEFFTTNYDRSLEVIWENALHQSTLSNVDLNRGFRQKNPHRGLEFDPVHLEERPDDHQRVVKLHKLHGSLNWIRRGDAVLESPSYQYLGSHAVIYPLRKHAISEPFKSLLTRFQMALGRARLLIVIGSSLRDQHIRGIIEEAMQARSILKVVIHDPAAEQLVDGFPREFEESLFPAPGLFGSEEGTVELRNRVHEVLSYAAG